MYPLKNLSWVLPIKSTCHRSCANIRARVSPKSGLSPFEILFGRPLNTGIGFAKRQQPTTTLCEGAMLNNCAQLSSTI